MRRLLRALLGPEHRPRRTSVMVAPATAQVPPDDPSVGLVYDGLRRV